MFRNFLGKWGVYHCLSSSYYPQSNGRAELGVKSAKRMLRDNVDTNGSINNDKVACAVLQYHNTPLHGFPMSPAQLLFGRPLADFLPMNPKAYSLHPHWVEQLKLREKAVAASQERTKQQYNRTAHPLKPLKVGQRVVIQNKTKRHYNKWNRTGTIVAALPFRQYQVKLDETGHITLRNRKFIKPTALKSSPRDSPFSGPRSGPDYRYPNMTGPVNPTTNAQYPTLELNPTPTNAGHANSHVHQGPDTHNEPSTSREPLILRRLRPFNAPGRNEIPTQSRRVANTNVHTD